jgi:hypothetical protein
MRKGKNDTGKAEATMCTRAVRLTIAVGLLVFSENADADEFDKLEEAPESAVSSPPMEMDDPATPGPFGLEVNFVGTMVQVGDGRGREGLLDANYGIGDRIQLKYERPYVSEGSVGEDFQGGLGATELGVKWRFVDHDGLQIATYPNYQFDDGFKLKDEAGNEELSPGRNVYLPLLISQTFKRVYTAAINIGYRRNFENRGDDVNLALGFGRAIGGNSRLLTELYSERDPGLNNRQTDVRIGYCILPFPHQFEKARFELPLFASLGHSIGRTEVGEPSVSYAFGMSFILKPKGE